MGARIHTGSSPERNPLFRRRLADNALVMIRLSALPLSLGAAAAALLFWRQSRALRDVRARERRRHVEGQESERRRIAREIHDGPIQELHSLMISVATPAGPDPAALQAQIEHVVDDLRAISEDLHPPALLPFGLSAAIEAHVHRVQERYPETAFELDLYPDGHELSPPFKLAVFRIAQEAISNAVRHAEAERVRVEVRLTREALRLRVADDGGGFDALRGGESGGAAVGGSGLTNMMARAEEVGGTLRVSPSQDGTTVELDLPLGKGDVGTRRVPARTTRATLSPSKRSSDEWGPNE